MNPERLGQPEEEPQKEPEKAPEHPERKYNFELMEKIEPDMISLVKNLKTEIESGEYDALVGDDVKGRIPTLVLNRIFKTQGKEKINTYFFAGGNQFTNSAFEPKYEHGEFQGMQEVGWKAAKDYLKKLNLEDKKVLVVTEMSGQGDTLHNIGKVLQDIGLHQFDFAVLYGISEDERNTERFLRRLNDRSWEKFSSKGPKIFTSGNGKEPDFLEDFKKLGGVKKPEKYSPVTQRDNQTAENIQAAREDVNLMAQRIIQKVWGENKKSNLESKSESKETLGEKVMTDFQKFVEAHSAEFDPNNMMLATDLADYFYINFYAQDINKIKYKDDDQTKKTIENYNRDATDFIKTDQNENVELLSKEGENWIYHNINGGFDHEKDIGRFYLNLKPEKTIDFYKKSLEKCVSGDVHVQMKIPMKGKVRSFNKSDKMVIYFNSKEEEKMLNIIEELHQENKDSFDDTGIPRFTAEVKNKDGSTMDGIGFGEDPQKDKSFGTLRSEMLSEIYIDIRNLKRKDPDVVNDLEKYQKLFQKYCKMRYFGVDSQNPAFNVSRKKNKSFPLIRKMSKHD